MKQTIKELCKREGKKSQTAIGNVKETVSKYQDMLAEEIVKRESNVFVTEFLNSLHKKITKLDKTLKGKNFFIEFSINVQPQKK